MPVESHAPVLEHHGVEVEIRGIRPVLRPDVSDVLGFEVDPADLERLEGSLVDVGHAAVRHADLVDLQGIDRLERFLPAVVLDRCRILRLGRELLEVHVDGGLRQREVGDQPAPEERLPLDARVQPRRLEDGRVGMGLLEELQIVEGQREPDRMEAELADLRGVPLQLLVHLADDDPPERLVDEERADHGQRHDHQDGDACVAKPATAMWTAVRRHGKSCPILASARDLPKRRPWPVRGITAVRGSLQRQKGEAASCWRRIALLVASSDGTALAPGAEDASIRYTTAAGSSERRSGGR